LKFGPDLLRSSLEKVVKPNVAFLHECGIDAIGIASLCLAKPWLLGTKPEQVRAMAVRAESVGVPRGSGMFRLALQAVAFRSDETIAVKVEQLKNAFRWSDADRGGHRCL
jgi:mTERF domain-containing protein